MFSKSDIRRKSIVTLELSQDCCKIFCKSGPWVSCGCQWTVINARFAGVSWSFQTNRSLKLIVFYPHTLLQRDTAPLCQFLYELCVIHLTKAALAPSKTELGPTNTCQSQYNRRTTSHQQHFNYSFSSMAYWLWFALVQNINSNFTSCEHTEPGKSHQQHGQRCKTGRISRSGGDGELGL